MELDKYLELQCGTYTDFDGAHDIQHVKEVTDNALKLADVLGLDRRITKTAATYHDLGLRIDREYHHLHSGGIARNDIELRNHFTEEEIEIIVSACNEHRASYKGEYTSIYSYVISDADRTNSVERMIERSYKYTRNKLSSMTEEEVYCNVLSHLRDKYGRESGYGKYRLKESKELFDTESTWRLLEDETEFITVYNRVTRDIM